MTRPVVVEWRERSTVETSLKGEKDPSTLMNNLTIKQRGALALAFVLNNKIRETKGLDPQENGQKILAAHIVKERRVPRLLQRLIKDASRVVFEPISYALKQNMGKEIDADQILKELGELDDDHALTDQKQILAEMKEVDKELSTDKLQLNKIGKQKMPQTGQQNAPLLLKTKDEDGQVHYVLLEKGAKDNQAGKDTIAGKMSNEEQIISNNPSQPLRKNALFALKEINLKPNQAQISEKPVFMIIGEHGNPDFRNYVYEAFVEMEDIKNFAANSDAVKIKTIPATADGVKEYLGKTPEELRPSYLQPLFEADLARTRKKELSQSLKQAVGQLYDATRKYAEVVAPQVVKEAKLTTNRWTKRLKDVQSKGSSFLSNVRAKRNEEPDRP